MVSEEDEFPGTLPSSKEPSYADLVDEILSPDPPTPEQATEAPLPKKKKFKPKGLFLGSRRDTGEPIDIKSMVLARHAAMLGSTGSGKTVMAKALIEEAALAKIPSLIIDPQGDLARLALGIEPAELEKEGGDVSRAKKLMEMCEVRIWTPLRSKGLPLCIDPFRAPPPDLDAEEAITAWDMVAAGFTSLAGYDVEKAQGKSSSHSSMKFLLRGQNMDSMSGIFKPSQKLYASQIKNSRATSTLSVFTRSKKVKRSQSCLHGKK